ncbi:MAG: hypothetical protein WCJ30_10570 [Deltaproteobacteria bacterium]
MHAIHLGPAGFCIAVCAAAAAWSLPARASAFGHEPYVTVGGGYFGGSSRVAVGLGGVGYRFYPNPALALYVESRWMLYGGNAFTTSNGGLYVLHVRAWAPAIGLQATAVFGQQLRVLDAGNPGVPSKLSFSAQARLAPLRFERDRFTAAVLVVDLGIGIDDGRPFPAISLSIADIGVRF